MPRPIVAGSAALVLFVLGSTSSIAQGQEPVPDTSQPVPETPQPELSPSEVNSQELQQFANVLREVERIRQERQPEIAQAIESEGLSPERFEELLAAEQNPQDQTLAEVSPEELEQFERARTEILQIQDEFRSDMQQVVEAEGLDMQRFQEIYFALEQDPALRQELQQILQN